MEDLREDLDAFCAEVFASIPRKDSRAWGNCYLRGLMLDGRRKSIQPMAERLPDGGAQALGNSWAGRGTSTRACCRTPVGRPPPRG